MIEIRIRPEFDDKSFRLCDWPADRLDEVIPMIKSWGVFFSAVDGGEPTTFSGQIRVDESAAYFEVICHEEAE